MSGASEKLAKRSVRGVGGEPFRRLLTTWTATSVADGVRATALPLYTAVSTRDPISVSAVAVAEVLPWLLIALPAGALVDRLPCRPTLVVAHSFRALLTLLLVWFVHTGQAGMFVLLGCAFLLSGAETFADSATQSLLVSAAGEEDLERANGRFVGAETVGVEIAGPLAAAGLFAWRPSLCFALTALAFGFAALWIPRVSAEVEPVRAGGERSMLGEIRQGTAFVLRSPGLRVVVGTVGAVTLLTGAVNTIAVLFALESLGLAPSTVPVLFVCAAAGTLVASRVTSWLSARFGGANVMIAALFVLAGGMAILELVRVPVAAWSSYFVMGFGAGAWNVLSSANRQRLTPESMMGRVTSAYRVFAWGLMPLGAGLAGPLAEVTSPAAVISVSASLVAVVAVLCAPLLRRLDTAARE
ncbi:MFS-type transporter involved in bile tolerance, Atg22 family [Actinopolyspora xinjiangensis]|uniref:MFS-type transporter involved in bile tolerance, Atg22 family n=1 Tax=Actinopolyspora xinjiangensis TaxID=405564 RepID=A0A1H0NJQ0_9ACTN|nr:MFS-type transporter involved in bile tolerance, Atg22 family [Actinopolyspora xinjiangensis]